ncbi:proton-conducting transporter membrane subunit [Leptospira santarosai]|uniref:Formate hydrogenase n=1 Tax=Leptospira santarosai serovar Shermani str. LT 821 TaxID=758847 RepID=K8YAX9_9LEPT|nr:proton-conducting transporter membrane subunit [Leptospira santarosai]EKT87617.1 formate hydrogenase [Leptospira santarosai serovar Shermani str. LT 821]EMM75726.1 NADH-ubiquinone/plastoquinone complex I subunit [Leptospira santarosai str. 2000030832]EPG81493.1 NADH-ubiquinone/plastoquinone complex I subunit [Leptospira santarosai serovar Shermani str. 1342KT]KXZ28163.1 formate hydrogenase [Leptospira santarosai]MDI7187796.1 proton-conducting transporter membrane subunit [Leptospira santaro
MIILSYLIIVMSFVVPFLVAKVLGKDFFGRDTAIFIGLILQTVLGMIISVYIHGYEHRKKATILLGYAVFFLGTGLCYLVGKTLWLILFWELSTVSAFLLYQGGKWTPNSIKSFIALVVAGGVGAFCFTYWIYSPEGDFGNIFLVAGLLVKAAFFGFHFWLPEAHSGSPAHASAAYSGILVNLPLILFYQLVAPWLGTTVYIKILIPLAGFGVLWAGLSSLFSRDAKKAIAYSTVENMNFLFLCILLSALWKDSEVESLKVLSRSFSFLFILSLIHHSVSKTFQFLVIGYLTKISGFSNVDQNTGVGRISGLPTSLLSLGTISFLAIPGTTGFLSEATFVKLVAGVLEIPGQSAILVLPLLILVSSGLVLGAAGHLRIFLGMVLSRPRTEWPENKPSHSVFYSIFLSGVLILVVSFGISAYALYHSPTTEWLDEQWYRSLAIVNFVGIGMIVFVGILGFRTKISKRKLWDCGGNYGGADVAIPSDGISDPLFPSLGRYFTDEEGNSRLDEGILQGIIKFLNTFKTRVNEADEESISINLAFSSVTVVILLFVIIGLKLTEVDLWKLFLSTLTQ